MTTTEPTNIAVSTRRTRRKPDNCPVHGRPTKRDACKQCNAAYMRTYLRKRRVKTPCRDLWSRAKERARRGGIPFELDRCDLFIPSMCPVLGISLLIGGVRSERSPSLDRIDPKGGYVQGNVRVISDKANRLKSNRSIEALTKLAVDGDVERRLDYAKIVSYLHREQLLIDVKAKAAKGGRAGEEWDKIAQALDALFARGDGNHW